MKMEKQIKEKKRFIKKRKTTDWDIFWKELLYWESNRGRDKNMKKEKMRDDYSY